MSTSKRKTRQAIYIFHFETVLRSEKQDIKIILNLAQKVDEVVDEPAEEPIMGAPQTHDEEEVIDILKMVTMVVMMITVKMIMIVITMMLS